ncbi:hypothetical protein J2S74_005316 [Evansella vedderi]|uniref:Phosphoribosyltransferase domain-containing protein n=1 Tax=Evansella vedderi TaxID=38282 RepID=A0ABU0A2Y6_9BACI|nr:hypothetical protein [Evansella vedderi]MDQ0257853.1 hypothetical protein [Evansella vedderi]
MLSFTVKVQHIIMDYHSLLKEYESVVLNDLINSLSKKYKVIILSELKDFQGEQKLEVFTKIRSIDQLMVPGTSTVLLTGDTKKLQAFHLKNISTILMGENVSRMITAEGIYSLPDLILSLERVKGFLLYNMDFGYRNEIAVENYLKKSGNSVLQKPKGLLYVAGEMEHQLYKNIKAELIVPGRFFTKGDTRAYADVLTLYLLKFKDEKSFAVQVFAESLKTCLDLLKQKQTFDIITTVPSRTSINKLDSIFYQPALMEFRNKVHLNLLKVETKYKQQKYAGNKFNRAHNVHNKISFTKQINGHVLLIDDIYTTGATTLECARMLYQAGAKSVTILPFGVTQHKVTTNIRKPVLGSGGDIYNLRLNNQTGEPFWVSAGSNYEEYHQIRNYYYGQ